VQIRPKSGKVCIEEFQRFEVEFVATRKVEFVKHEMLLLVRGCPPHRLTLSACILTPNIEIEPKVFAFKPTTIGHSEYLDIELSNKTSIQTDVHLSLFSPSRELQEWYDAIDIVQSEKHRNESVVLDKLDQHELGQLLDSLSNKPRATKKTQSSEKSLLRLNNTDKEDVPRQRHFVFRLKANKAYHFRMSLTPAKAVRHNFDLLFVCQGQEKENPMVRNVTCAASSPRFLCDPMSGVVEFARQIMQKSDSLVNQKRHFSIINTSNDSKLFWALDKAVLDGQTAFKVEPKSGVIDEESSAQVSIEFCPERPVAYELRVPLFFDQQTAQSFEIKVRGEGTLPKVLLSTEEVVLPATPVRVPSFSYFSVANDGYQNSKFAILIPIEYQKIGLSAAFVNGNMLGITNSQLVVKVSFVSKVQVSFIAKVGIEDDQKTAYFVTVSGSSDNSILTYSAFLHLGYFVNTMFTKGLGEHADLVRYDDKFQRSWAFTFNEEKKDIEFSLAHKGDKETKAKSPQGVKRLSKMMVENTKADDNLVAIETYQQVASSIRGFVGEYGMSPIGNFPEDLVESNGGLFAEFLDCIVKFGIERPQNDSGWKQSERVEELVGYYNKVLNLLKEGNAFVNSVRPHFLLSQKDLLWYVRHHAESYVSDKYYQVSDSEYRLLSLQSWTTMYLQAIKVFFVGRVALRDIKGAVGLMAPHPLQDRNDPHPFSPRKDGQGQSGNGKRRVRGLEMSSTMTRSKSFKSKRKEDRSQTNADPLDNPPSVGQHHDLTPAFNYESSAVFSQSEAFLLRWLEVAHFHSTKTHRRILSFSDGLSNCYTFACAFDCYIETTPPCHSLMNSEAALCDDVLSNLNQLRQCTSSFGVKDEYVENDFVRNNPVSMLLLTAHLFKILPTYVPKGTVDFTCALHEKVVKEIAISNPFQKPVMYTVRVEGSRNFEAEVDAIKVEPKQTVMVPVGYFAKTSLPSEGKVYFQNRRNGKSIAGAVVMRLSASVNRKYSMKVFTITNVSLYDTGVTEVVVVNPFPKDVEFKVRLDNVPPLVDSRTGNKDKIKVGQFDGPDKAGPPQILPAFFVKQDRLWIRKGGEAKLYVQYLPITNDKHHCFINFQDLKVGEMQYEVVGAPKPPPVLSEFKISVPVEELSVIEIEVTYNNKLMHNALSRLVERLKEANDSAFDKTVEQSLAFSEREFEVETEPNEYFSNATVLVMPAKGVPVEENGLVDMLFQNSQKKDRVINVKPEGSVHRQSEQHIKYQFFPLKKIPVRDLVFKVTFKGRGRHDLRIYQLTVNVLPKKISATIEIKTTARVPVTQNVPLFNNDDSDCQYRIKFHSVLNGHLFDFNNQNVTVRKKSVVQFPVRFLSSWIEKAEAVVTFSNVSTLESFEFQLKAESSDPLSEECFEFAMKAKQHRDLVLRIRNPMADSRVFSVECDIPNAVYEKRVVFEDNSPVDFVVSLTPNIVETVLHSLTFRDDQKRYFWYLVELKVDSPEAIGTIKVQTEIRQPVAGVIRLENNSEVLMRYEVFILGDSISGDSAVEVDGLSSASYAFYYFPIKVENTVRKVGFVAENKSEIWYEVECVAEEAKVIKLPTMKAELGKSATLEINFVNPLKKKRVVVASDCKDNELFKISPKKFEIKPNSVFSVQLTFTPKDMSKLEGQVIRFVSKELGIWTYQAFGTGVAPSENELVVITTKLTQPINHFFQWRNPFMAKCYIRLILESAADQQGVFEIISPKQEEQLVLPGASCHVLIRFSPTMITTYYAKLVIRTQDAIHWVYPIKAVSKSIQDNKEYLVSTKCDVEVEVAHAFPIRGLLLQSGEEVFDFSLEIDHEQSQNIRKWLKVEAINNRISKPEDTLSFNFVFLPHKPFKASLEFLLNGQSGGRWKFKLVLNADKPDFFDTLQLVTGYAVTKTIRFQLFNTDKKNSTPFVAGFEDETELEFTLTPTKGLLEPKIKDGTFFELSFCPKHFGKSKEVVAFVETSQQLFRFRIVGTFAKYPYQTGKPVGQ
jgi:hypothetical protein